MRDVSRRGCRAVLGSRSGCRGTDACAERARVAFERRRARPSRLDAFDGRSDARGLPGSVLARRALGHSGVHRRGRRDVPARARVWRRRLPGAMRGGCRRPKLERLRVLLPAAPIHEEFGLNPATRRSSSTRRPNRSTFRSSSKAKRSTSRRSIFRTNPGDATLIPHAGPDRSRRERHPLRLRSRPERLPRRRQDYVRLSGRRRTAAIVR